MYASMIERLEKLGVVKRKKKRQTTKIYGKKENEDLWRVCVYV